MVDGGGKEFVGAAVEEAFFGRNQRSRAQATFEGGHLGKLFGGALFQCVSAGPLIYYVLICFDMF